jgi:FtsP/CotA-like multicopper oxidase with cupredoxin domain
MDQVGNPINRIASNSNSEVVQTNVFSHHASRRAFLTQALAAASGLVLGELALLSPLEAAAPPQTCDAMGGPPASRQADAFKKVAEFNSKNGRLDVEIRVVSGYKKVAVIAEQGYQCRPMLLRYYAGADLINGGKWPIEASLPGPGPTLRVRVGDTIHVRLLNAISPADFGRTTAANEFACDTRTGVTQNGTIQIYPGDDTPPSCFHGDNVTNLHYHGSHVSPDGRGDNVMVDVAPKEQFENLFTLPLPPSDGELDDKSKPFRMGQAPGTHWYHAHKHGSVALQLLSGMAGAFIVEGEFDEELEKHLPGLRSTEKVFVVQQIGDQVCIQPGSFPLVTGLGGNPFPLVNGQVSPKIDMAPGEIQRWRFINATMSQTAWLNYQFEPVNSDGPAPEIRQIAYDGIQLAPERYLDPAFGRSQQFNLHPGGRLDILVKAPPSGQANLIFQPMYNLPTPLCQSAGNSGSPILLTLNVTNSPPNDMKFPDQETYPKMPAWLKWDESDPRNEIKAIRILKFNNETTGGFRPAINAKAFDGTLNQCLPLNTADEWILENYWDSSIHTYHIHVNPFQVLEVFDPRAETQVELKPPYNWADTVAIPASKTVGTEVTPGRVKIRTRYTDFTGTFVLHCHLLDHEDRGMMQMVEIVDMSAPKIEKPMHH